MARPAAHLRIVDRAGWTAPDRSAGSARTLEPRRDEPVFPPCAGAPTPSRERSADLEGGEKAGKEPTEESRVSSGFHWRKGRDSNSRRLAPCRFSRAMDAPCRTGPQSDSRYPGRS